MAAWRAHGNGYKPDLSDPDVIDAMGDEDAYKRSTGFFAFPVCDLAEAWANLAKDGMKDNPHYPCNP